jgi:hypothetical protein
VSTPTESAEAWFRQANDAFRGSGHYSLTGKSDLAQIKVAEAGMYLARGLGDLSIGLRATYQLLDEVKRMLQRPR